MLNSNSNNQSGSNKLLFLTKYDLSGASSRYRTYQYLQHLGSLEYCVVPLLTQEYLQQRFKRGRLVQLGLLAKAFTQRFLALLNTKEFDLVFIEYELIPYFPSWLERWLHWNNTPFIVDYDDAIFHQYDKNSNSFVRFLLGKKISTVMRLSKHVIAGNTYLAEYAKQAGAKSLSIIPTVIDIENYSEALKYQKADTFTIVWIGSPSTTVYLKEVLPALQAINKRYPIRLRLIGAEDIDLPGVTVERFTWQQQKEVEYISECHVGIMPLPDTHWTRGKCGFKLIQYMACSLPVIASPVGVNAEIVESGRGGFLARNQTEWVEAMEQLINNSELQVKMGEFGYKKVEMNYSLQSTSKKFQQLIINACS